MPVRRARRAVLLLSFLAVACNDGRPPSGPVPVHPVSGQVTYQGKPAPGVLVVFHPSDSAPPSKPGPDAQAGPPRSTGKTDDEGRFRMHTYVGDDGVPVGSYRVTVAATGGGETRNVMAKQVAKALSVGLPSKYADPKTTDLAAQVKEGSNELPAFVLSGEPAGGASAKPGGRTSQDPR